MSRDSLTEGHKDSGGKVLSILHLNAWDVHGGAERLAGDLLRVQREAGHRAEMLVGRKVVADSPAVAFSALVDASCQARCLAEGLPDYELRGSHGLTDHPMVRACDVIHVHNLYGGYFNPFSLISLSHYKPVVWSMHDMQAMTGYCSHALDCGKWRTGCGECPDLTRPGPRLQVDSTARLWRDREIIYQNSRLWMAGGSGWILECLREGLFKNHPTKLIPNGIDTRIFCPGDSAAARAALGLGADAPVVAGLARKGALAHPWKGGQYLLEALGVLRGRFPDLVFLNLGAEGESAEPWIRNVSTESKEQMAAWLRAVDVLVYPSLADTAPLAVMEALACGVPVVAFRVGGIPDQIREGISGFLVEPGDVGALAAAAEELLSDRGLLREFGRAAREDAVARFDIRQCGEGYVDYYREAISATGGQAGGGEKDAGWGAEMAALQRGMMEAKTKLKAHKSRRIKDGERLRDLLETRWMRAGLKLGMLPAEIRRWVAAFSGKGK
ncbi:MAG: hypothetical protein JWL81_1316 [Verrucomicrobiales bacterium]|nr:hypothetical protein [Verrucomicrobiales bacterium]